MNRDQIIYTAIVFLVPVAIAVFGRPKGCDVRIQDFYLRILIFTGAYAAWAVIVGFLLN